MKRKVIMALFVGLFSSSGLIVAGPGLAKEAQIDILTTQMGGAGYVMSFALVDILKKANSWVKLKGIETSGVAENVKTLALEPEKRKTTVIFANAATAHQSKVADPPYNKPYGGLRFIALFNPSRLFFVTGDPGIKTPKDLKGKKVSIFPRGSAGIVQWQAMVQNFGVAPKEVEWVYLPMGPGIDALADRRVNASWGLAGPPPLNDLTSPIQQLLAQRKDVYFVAFSKEAAKAAREKTGYPTYVGLVPAGTYSPNQPDLYCHVQFLSWWADEGMDEGIVYEITKQIYENVDKFARYHALGKSMTNTNIAQAVTEDLFHPGARKFYREKGIKMGAEE